jgi:hemerythrin-like metal-binding protein
MAAILTELFPWNDTFCVHIGVIDMQHKKLVGMINELHKAMTEGHGKEKLGQVLSKLIDYTRMHFGTEEKLMQSHGYADYLAHKIEHDHLTSTVLDLQGKFKANEIGLSVEVMEFLKDWLGKHILGSDKRYAPFLNSQGVR